MYSHLSREQRLELAVLRREGLSLRQIAGRLSVAPSTVSRELRRNDSARVQNGCHAGDAQRRSRNKRSAANTLRLKVQPGSRLERLLTEKIKAAKWSPEQVCGWLKASEPGLVIGVQTVYDWIYKEKRELLPCLHCLKGRYRRTRADGIRRAARAAKAAERHISRRGRAAEKRLEYGHREGDTVVGAGRSGYLATFVERKSGFLAVRLIVKEDFGAAGFAKAAKEALGGLPGEYLLTLTLDNGPEMAFAERIERQTGPAVCYATPYHSRERGCNENANGLLRYFFPKKMDFAGLTQAELDRVACLLNNRPRKRLGWQTPEQMLKR